MKGLFLDDERNPEDVTWLNYPDNVEWVVVRDYEDFEAVVCQHWDVVSFDHDIQDYSWGEENTGYDCLKLMVEHVINKYMDLPDIVEYHTQNTVGKDNMKRYLDSFKEFKSDESK